MTATAPPDLRQAVLDAVCELSRQAQPATRGMIKDALLAQGVDAAELDANLDARLDDLRHATPPLAAFPSLRGEVLYHDPALLSATYVRILDRKGSPIQLMAEEIRLSSRDYQRPLPVELFQAPPFDLTREDVETALAAMAASPEHADISFTVTASGAVYLFSLQHLNRIYAEFKAEYAENLAMNP